MRSTLISNSKGVAVLSNLWQSYGGVYGDYFAILNAASIALLFIFRARKCLPWLQEPLQNWLLSTEKMEVDGVALWATGNLKTHHQHIVAFCLGFSARQRFGGSWMTSPDVQTLWYGAFLRITSKACMYTLLIALLLQYNKISWFYTVSTFVIVMLSRTYEVFYPWLASIDSPHKLREQMKTALMEFDEQVSKTVLTSTKKVWPQDFTTVTHTRLEELKLQMKRSGIFVSLSVLGNSVFSHIHLSNQGWVNGSGLLASANLVKLASGLFGIVTAEDSTLFWKISYGYLYFQCFLIVAILSLPAFVCSLNKVVNIMTDSKDGHERLVWWSEFRAWWLDLKGFLHLLVTSGFPFTYQSTVLGSRASTFFWKILSRLEGIDLALYGCLTLCLSFSVQLSLYSVALLIKVSGLGGYVGYIWSKTKSLLIWWIAMMPFFPGLSSVGIELLNAETALAEQRMCRDGQCITTLKLDAVLAHLEEIVAAKGAIQEPCTFFAVPLPANENIESLEEEFKRRAIALGLMKIAETAVEKLRKERLKEGASALHSLLRLLRVYTMDSTVPNAKTQESMTAVANLVEDVMTEFTTLHWERYKKRDVLEANACECVSERDWLIMVAQLNVNMLLVYTGWRSASLYWPYTVLFESDALREWVSGRSSACNGSADCAFVLAH